jgi:hypothetical protein
MVRDRRIDARACQARSAWAPARAGTGTGTGTKERGPCGARSYPSMISLSFFPIVSSTLLISASVSFWI